MYCTFIKQIEKQRIVFESDIPDQRMTITFISMYICLAFHFSRDLASNTESQQAVALIDQISVGLPRRTAAAAAPTNDPFARPPMTVHRRDRMVILHLYTHTITNGMQHLRFSQP